MRTRVVVALFAVALSRRRMWVLRRAGISVGLAGRTVAGRAGARGRVTTAPAAGNADCDTGSQPAPRSAAYAGCHAAGFDDGGDRRAWPAHCRCRPGHLSVRLSEPGYRATGGLRHRHRTRDRAGDLRRPRPHPAASAQSKPTRISVAVRRGRRGGADLLDHLCAQGSSSISPRCTTKPTKKSSRVKGSGIDSFAALSGKRVCAVSGTTSLSKLFELNPQAEDLRCDHLDGLPPDAATGTGRRDQHRRRGAERAGETGPERGRGRGQHRQGALRHRGQQRARRPGSVRQRCSREDPQRRNLAAALRRPGCSKSSDHPQVLRNRATRIDHERR